MDEVSVLLSDLESLKETLNAAYMRNQADDLSEQYRKLSNRLQYSALTKQLEMAIGRVQALIDSAEEEE
jgi:hypothetical protein